MKNKKDKNIITEISSNAVHGNPEDVFGMLNKYGTYEIQPTSDTENTFPLISSGLADKTKKITKNDIKNENKQLTFIIILNLIFDILFVNLT